MARSRICFLLINGLAVAYVANGYWFYVSGWIPLSKDAEAVDRKLIEKYGIDMSKWERARRKKAGLANLHYLRHGRTFILIATHGKHRFFEEEAAVIRDIRRVPFKLDGYSVSYRNGHASVRIAQESYKRFKASLVDPGPRRTTEHTAWEFGLVDFAPYAPIRWQLLNLVRVVNRARKRTGLELIPTLCLRLKRRIYRPFEDGCLRNA